MYKITMLSQPTMQWVNLVMSTHGGRSLTFPIAAAYSIANRLPLVPQPVQDLSEYYRLNLKTEVLGQLDQLNTVIPFDTQATRFLVEQFYTYRYRQAFPVSIPLALNPETALEDFFGLRQIFGDETIALIKAEGACLTRMIDGIKMFLDDVNRIVARQDEVGAKERFLESEQ